MKKTDNHYLEEKRLLRKEVLTLVEKPKILECFSGKGILYDNIDQKFYSRMENYVFQGKPLTSIIKKYKANADWKNDKDGKILFGMLKEELRNIRKDQSDLIESVVKYLLENDTESVDVLTSYLRNNLT